MRRVLAGISLAFCICFGLAFVFSAHAQTVTLIEGLLVTEDGKPVANQPIVIEGQKNVSGLTMRDWLAWIKKEPKSHDERVIATTDWQGTFQIINLPAGNYTIKVVRPGSEPIPVKKFSLIEGYSKVGVKGSVTPEQLGRTGS